MKQWKVSFFCGFLMISILFLFNGVDFVLAGNDFEAAIIPSDSKYTSQWYLEKIGAPRAWDLTQGNPHVIIAVLDTGVDIDHPDLKDNIWKNEVEIPGNEIDDDKNGYIDDINGWDFVNNVADPNPKFQEGFTNIGINHGTIVAGIAAAQGNNAFGISGVSWNSKIMPLKVLNDSGEGMVSNVIKAIDYAVQNKADIINLSFVGMGYSSSLEDAITRAYKAGVIIVAAAGNEDSAGVSHSLDDEKAYPVCYGGSENMIIGVAASDALDQKAEFSNYGFDCIDITAPGTSFLGLSVYSPEKDYNQELFNYYYNGFWSGTSMAAPLISGSIALIKSMNPGLSRDEVINILTSSADNISRLNPSYLGQLGSGRVNISRAIERIHDVLTSTLGIIMSVPQNNNVSQVKVFEQNNDLDLSFFAYDKNFRGGANVAAGDLDGDGLDEIITGAGPGGGPQVAIFNIKGEKQNQFFAYGKNFSGGINVAVGDVNSDGKDEIITGTGKGGGPQVRVFDQNGKVKGQFFAYDKNFRGGVNVGTGDINQDGVDEIVTGAGPGGTPHIRLFNSQFELLDGFLGYESNFNGGVNVAIIKVKNEK